jgi:hypothetical protein
MRNLVEVIDRMKAVIPTTEVRLLNQLESARSSALYTSPETIGLRWGVVAELLEDRFCEDVGGQPQEPKFEAGSWEQQVFNIWMNKETP